MLFVNFYLIMVVMIVFNTSFVLHYFGVKKVDQNKIFRSSVIIGLLWPLILLAIFVVTCWSIASFIKNRIRTRE